MSDDLIFNHPRGTRTPMYVCMCVHALLFFLSRVLFSLSFDGLLSRARRVDYTIDDFFFDTREVKENFIFDGIVWNVHTNENESEWCVGFEKGKNKNSGRK